MPWNDLYDTGRKISPGLMYPVVEINFKKPFANFQKATCADSVRRFVNANPVSGLGLVLRIYYSLRRRNMVLNLHVHNPTLAPIALIAKLFCPKLRVITTQHNDWRYFRFHQKIGLRILARLSAYYIACGRSIAQTIPAGVHQYLVRNGRMGSIPNGIRPYKLSLYDLDPIPLSENINGCKHATTVTAVVVARMVPQKNCFFILRLLKETQVIDRLIWFGDGPEREEIEREIDRLRIADRIELRGRRPRDEVFKSLAENTFYIAASKWEGLSVADLEAVALGCWPIMSDIIQRQEIADVLHIPLFPLTDLAAWVRGIESFLNHSDSVQREMRDRIKKLARKEFDLNATVEKYVQTYRNTYQDPMA
jgi:glycosyltransferase involved in cell wall biosynthesis